MHIEMVIAPPVSFILDMGLQGLQCPEDGTTHRASNQDTVNYARGY
jgi:hypothetical protein